MAGPYSDNRPLNLFVTLHCEKAGIPKHSVQRFLIHFKKLVSEWLRRRTGQPSLYIWISEATGGLHFHFLVHVPEALGKEYRMRQNDWIEAAKGKLSKRVLVSRRIRFSKPGEDLVCYLERGLLGLLRYTCKGIEPQAAKQFGIDPVSQGRIVGKRAGWSEALGEDRRVWPVIRVANRSRIWIAGQESRRRRLFELLAFPSED